jgi:myo-inositol-1(or 4)-monophosphatase
LLQTAIEAAQRAGRLIAERYPMKHNVSYKGFRDLVTEADIGAENAILSLVRKRFPDHAILSEESRGGRIGQGYTWVIDPLDGTSNYAHRVPIFSVSIAVLEHGRPFIGVVYDPMREHLFVAQRGKGATLNDQPLQVSSISELRRAVVGLDWARGKEARREVLSSLERVAVRCHTVRIMGSAALGLTYVAAGWLDGYFHVALYPWDAAAAVLLIARAGGRCTTFEGEPYPITSPCCVATNGHIHQELLDALREAKFARRGPR